MLEWKKLGDLCEIKTGKLNANAQVEDGQYPFFTCDANPFKIDKYAFDTEAIIISGNGSQVGHLNYYKGKFNAYQRTYVLDGFDGNIFYFYHYLKAVIRPYVMKKSMKGSVPYITLPMLTELPIPTPSLSEQSRIVSILDTFTASIDNLKQQIEQRRKQYEHYRDQLLDLEGKEGVEMRALGDVCKPITPPKKINTIDYLDKGLYPIIDQGQKSIVGYTNDDKALVPTREYVLFGDHTRIVKYFNGQFAQGADGLKILVPIDNLISRFVYFALSSIEVPSRGYSRHWSIAKEIPIPVPSLEEQSRIVSILDTFEQSIANLEEQLKLREKQYEYYRNKLLTFE